MAELSITRRRFLIASGWTAAGVTVMYVGGRSRLSGLPSFDMPDAEAAASWLQIGGDGRCRMFCPRAEMGQNASIGLAQIEGNLIWGLGMALRERVEIGDSDVASASGISKLGRPESSERHPK